MKKRLNTYWIFWKLNAGNKLQEAFVNRWTNALFMLGKSIRFAFMLTVLFTIKNNVKQFAGYTTDEIVIFFLVYQFVDVMAQVLYRGVYVFQNKIRTGEFDFYLLKPINPLFQALTGYPDVNDAIFLIPTTIISFYLASQLNITITVTSFIVFLLLLINTFLIVTALHITVLVFGLLTNEVDGVVWLYRDFNQFGRFPVSIYQEPLKFLLFFIVPIGMMVTVPAEILLHKNATYPALLAILIGIASFCASLALWKWSLKKYSSASS
jgi:ABC-2 type transport system permease protein